MTQTPEKLRNIALVAHVDHGKTTLLDALLRSAGTFAAHSAIIDRVMDNDDKSNGRAPRSTWSIPPVTLTSVEKLNAH
jgi:translation elongation factor EF-G